VRAREIRDVVEILVLPSLTRALDELTKKKGSRRVARLLVKQSVDQLRGMVREPEEPESSAEERQHSLGVAGIEV